VQGGSVDIQRYNVRAAYKGSHHQQRWTDGRFIYTAGIVTGWKSAVKGVGFALITFIQGEKSCEESIIEWRAGVFTSLRPLLEYDHEGNPT
jgi:hypothetical protein